MPPLPRVSYPHRNGLFCSRRRARRWLCQYGAQQAEHRGLGEDSARTVTVPRSLYTVVLAIPVTRSLLAPGPRPSASSSRPGGSGGKPRHLLSVPTGTGGRAGRAAARCWLGGGLLRLRSGGGAADSNSRTPFESPAFIIESQPQTCGSRAGSCSWNGEAPKKNLI